MEAQTLKTTVTDLQQVDPRNIIVEEGFNKREEHNYGDIHALALNMVQNGIMEALLGHKVRGEDKFILTEGHRRKRAVDLAYELHAKGERGFEDISKIERIPMRMMSAKREDRLLVMATTGFGKVQLTDLEKAGLYAEIIEIGIAEGKKRGEAVKDLVTRLGVSQATVYNILKLNELPEEIKEYISNGEISGSTVVTIVRDIKDADEQKKAVEDAILEVQVAAEKTGTKAKKVTTKNVKGLKAKSPIQKLKAVVDKIKAEELTNTRAKTFVEVMEALEEGRSINKIFELFL